MNRELIAELQSQYDQGRYREGIALAERTPLASLGNSLEEVRFLVVFGELLREMASYSRAREMFEWALKMLQAHPDEVRLKGRALNELARCFDEIRRPGRSETLYREALALLQTLGPNDLDYAHNCFDFGSLLGMECQIEQALKMLNESNSIYARVLGDDHHWTASCRYRIVDLEAISEGKPAKTIPVAEALLEARRRDLGKSHPLYGYALLNLAGALEMSDRFDEAEKYLSEAEAILEARLGSDHPALADVAIERLRTAMAQGDQTTTTRALEEARSIYQRSEANQRPIVLALSLTEALVLQQRGQIETMKRIAQELLVELKDETDLPMTIAQGLIELARVVPPEIIEIAEGATREAEQIASRRLPPNHYERLRIQAERAIVWTVMNNRAADVRNTLQKLKSGLQTGSFSRVESLVLRHHIGNLHEALGDHADAIQIVRKALTEARDSLGEDHRQTRDLENLHRYLMARDPSGQEMVSFLEGEQSRIEKQKGQQSEENLKAVLRLARELRAMMRLEPSEKEYRRALNLTKKIRGDDHQEVADLLAEMGEFFHDCGNLEAAERHYTLAFNLAEGRYGESHVSTAKYLFQIGTAHHDAGNLPQAEQYYRRSVDVCRELPEANLELAQALVGLAKIRQLQHDFSSAESHFSEGVKLFCDHRPALDLQRLHAEQSEGLFLRGINRWEEATRTLRSVAERMTVAPGVVFFLRLQARKHLADTLEMLGDLAEARRILFELVTQLKQQFPNNPDLAWPSREALARVLEVLGEPQEAVTIFEQSLSEMSELATRMPQGNAPLILSDVQSRLGDLQFRLSQFERAERLYTRSLELRQAGLGRFHLVIAESYLAQARLQSWVENGANDVEHLEAEAISITEACAGPRSPYVSRVRMEIATEKLRRGNVDAAKEELVKLRDAVARDLGDDSPELIPLLLRLSEAELTSENDEAAEAILSEAARILPETPAPAFALGIYPSLGKTRLRLENLDGAEEAYRNLLDYLTTNHGPNNYHSNLAWRGLSETTIRRGEIEETLKAFQRLAVLHDSVFDYLPFDPSHDSLRVITADSVEEDLQRLVHFVGSNCRDEAETIRFAAGFTARCKHFRIDGVGRDWLGRLAKRHPDHAAELLHLRDLRRQIALRLMKGAGSEGIAFHETLLREWQARANEIESRLTDHFPELLVIRSGIRGAVDAIFDHLPRDTGLIDIIHVMPGWFSNSIQKGKSWLTPNYFAFVYRPDQQEVTMVDLGGDRDIDPLIESLNSATGSSKEFWKRVWEPLLYHVGPVQKLIVSPDGEFLRFHPGAVQAPDGSWLLDQYEVRVVGAARDLESPRRNTVRRAGAQILVASDFGPMRETSSGGGFFGKLKRFFSGTSSTGSIAPARWPTQRQALRELATEGMSYPPLPGSRDEGFEIARLHHASIREGTQATAEQLLNPNGVGVLHLNSYTFSRPDYRKTNPKETPKKRSRTWENPLDGYGFALGGANRMLLRSLSESELERGVGIVTLCDVQEADWSQLDLCTLSLEPAPKSEILAARYGLVGVERTIRWAGVRSICFHPDPIPAEERRKILVAFHKHYLTSKTATEAYRKMAAELRDSVPDWRRFLCFEC